MINTSDILLLVQIVIAFLLTVAILLQTRGAGLSGTFGGDSVLYTTRRGSEKFLYVLTILLATVFIGISLAHLVI